MPFSADEESALKLDAEDSFRGFREKFHLPLGNDGQPLIYLAGNSLGLMPKTAKRIVEQELDDWAELAVDAHSESGDAVVHVSRDRARTGRTPGRGATGRSDLHEQPHGEPSPDDGHLLPADKTRFKILMEEPAFPSDTYAIKTQIVHHGLDPNEALVLARPREGDFTIRQDDIEAVLEKEGDQIALVLMAGVNFFTGQVFDIAKITAAAQKRGCLVGIDLAHAIGNVPLALHDWNVDFAVWCSYKYLNAGPGAVAGAFVHERHATNRQLPRLAGWFGNDPNTRFRLHLEPEFIPVASADGWQISNPPIFSLAPLRASLAIFDEAGGVTALRKKSIELTGYLQFLLEAGEQRRCTVITPREADGRGCQLSIRVHEHPKDYSRNWSGPE